MIYRPEQLGNLPVQEFVSMLRAEGVDTSHRNYGVTHLLPLFADGFDMYDGRGAAGPLSGDYPGYKPGSLPVTEDVVLKRLVGMPVFAEETPGYSDQVIAALRKVCARCSNA